MGSTTTAAAVVGEATPSVVGVATAVGRAAIGGSSSAASALRCGSEYRVE